MLEVIAAVGNLGAAWERVKDNAGGPGGDHETIGSFETGLDRRLHQLSQQMMTGDYWPNPIRVVEIPKPLGGIRVLKIPSVVDRVAQTAAAMVLSPVLDKEFSDASFGYRPGRSVQQAVRRVAFLRREGYRYVVDADIDDYFDSVPHDRLLARLERSISDERIGDLVARWLDAASDIDRGLPQGAPISPLLANLYLDDVDDAIEASGVRLVRFADDFLILCKDERAAGEAHEHVARLLAEQGLRLDPDKTRIAGFEDSVRFLGHLFVRSLALKEVNYDDGSIDLPPLGVAGTAVPAVDPFVPLGVARGDRAPRLRVLYVTEAGRSVDVRNRSFIVRDEGEEIFAVQPGRVDRIDLGPHVEVTTRALRHALDEAVPITFCDGHGQTEGTLEPRPAERAALHLAQARVVLDHEKRLALAAILVDGRLRNQRALLRRLNRRRKNPEVAKAAHDIGRLTRLLPKQPDLAGCMGVEGRAGALYWPALGACLEQGWKMTRRQRRPPPDPVNMAISYLATMLTRDIAALAASRGLHTGFGVLHASQDGRHALALDLIEEFRAPLVEGLAVYLFNNRILSEGMFHKDDRGSVRLWAPGVKALIRGYEGWLDRAIASPRRGEETSWRGLIDDQILAMADHIEGHASYRPYVMDY